MIAEPIENRTLIDTLIAEQRSLTAVERFARWHDERAQIAEPAYRQLIPLNSPAPGQQYAFEVVLDKCSGCKACVTACHSLNGLEEGETWRSVGLLISKTENRKPKTEANPKFEAQILDFEIRNTFGLRIPDFGFQQHVTTACHHCADPGCLNGCPVLAYDKDPQTGIVRHLDDQCIGCQYCVMKCPYEVPKYSSRLGIVRKCDMCSQRLAVGEAPACVQACPNEAIRITLVETTSVTERYRGKAAGGKERNGKSHPPTFSPAHFLPDAPNPVITLPTTRYLSQQKSPALIAADHNALRLEPPHWPLIIMLVLTQAAAGLFAANAIVGQTRLSVAGFCLLVFGLLAAVFHLGQPMKAWRAFLGWRKSWLSRELIAFNAFAGIAMLAIVSSFALGERVNWSEARDILLLTTAFVGLIAVVTSAMVYVDTARPMWCARISFGNFFGTTLLLGATFAAVILVWGGDAVGGTIFAAAALVIRTALFIWRRLELRAALRNPESPLHLNARIIHELLPWSTPARNRLFAASTLFGLLAIAHVSNAAPWWATVAALTTFGSEIVGRYVFFAASAGKRMPGGVTA